MMIILGAGGHCAEILQVLAKSLGGMPHHREAILIERYQIVVDTEEQLAAARLKIGVRSHAILAAGVPWGAKHATGTWGDEAFIAIGDPRARRAVYERHHPKIYKFIFITNEIHNGAKIDGMYLATGSYVDDTARIGEHVHVNRGAMVAHDCVVGEFSHIAPGAQLLGGATVGPVTEIGSNAVVLPGRKVGAGCRVGAGAVVTRDFGDNLVIRGNPARQIEELEPMGGA